MAASNGNKTNSTFGYAITEDFVIRFCHKLYEKTKIKAIGMLKEFRDKLEETSEGSRGADEVMDKIVAQCRSLQLDERSYSEDETFENSQQVDDLTLRQLLKAINESPYSEFLKRTQASLRRDMIYFFKLLTSYSADLAKKLPKPESANHELTMDSCMVMTEGSWQPAMIVSAEGSQRFQVKLIGSSKMTKVDSRYVAWLNKEASIGHRVVSRTMKTGCFELGIVAEMPTLRNSFRYLIFFDQQFSEYCRPLSVYMLAKQEPKVESVEVNDEYSQFINQYLNTYPERPMVRLRSGCHITLLKEDLNCRTKEWSQAEIIRVDCSMMLIKHERSGALEWLYRGSPRLLPIFRIYFKRQRSHASQRPNHDPSFVVFDEQKIPTARKSGSQKRRTSLTPDGVLAYCPKGDSVIGNTDLINRGQRVRIIADTVPAIPNYIPHTCNRNCTKAVRPLRKVMNQSRLLEPFCYGWVRHLKTCSDGSIYVEYRAPCGRSMSTIDQVDKYLLDTDNPLPIDRFCFDSRVRTDIQFRCTPEWSKFLKCSDITQGKERMAVACINQVDDEEPDIIDYQPERLPLNGIPMNTDPQFLEGCECKDNCRDKSKCSCWQKTMEGIETIRKAGLTNVPDGYSHRQLAKCIKSGVFECNVRCSCDSRCCNRVVQNGLSVEVQLFKTLNKGWGLRTLRDLPEGSFICTYAGHILTDVHADERDYCDQYFADMDFIEVLEELKESKGPSYRQMLGDLEMYILDGKICGNVGRYLNHSCMPNLYVQNVLVDTYDMRFPWIAFFTNRVVRAGEELCWDYQYDVDSVPGRKVMCRCGTRKCRGRLL